MIMANTKGNRKIKSVALLVFCLLCSCGLFASCKYHFARRDSSHKSIRFKFESGLEYMMPYDRGRQIKTVSVNLMAGVEFFRKVHLSLYGGATACYAYGYILQWNDFFEDVRYDNRAFGAGPAFLIRFEPVVYDKLSVGMDIGGACIFYSRDFPAGGDIYNFMWRLGGSINYRINEKYAFGVSGKWMHVSNGQGLNPHNPSYEAGGTSVQLVRYF